VILFVTSVLKMFQPGQRSFAANRLFGRPARSALPGKAGPALISQKNRQSLKNYLT